MTDELTEMIKREEQQDLILESKMEKQYNWIQENREQLKEDFISDVHADDFEQYCIEEFNDFCEDIN